MGKSLLIIIGVVIVLGVGLIFVAQRGKPNKNANTMPELSQRNATGVPADMKGLQENSEGKPSFPSGGVMPDVPEGSQPFFGTVSTLEEGSFSIKNPMGESKIIFTESTVFEGGSSTDLKNDISIGGYGTKNDDGSITALQIQINPSMPERGQFPSR